MANALFRTEPPLNEPVLSYVPGTPERSALTEAVRRVGSRTLEIPLQIGGLYGIERLGDQRGLEPVLEFMSSTPSAEAASWAKKALVRIAVQGGFTNTPSELDKLGTSAKLWRKWFRAARNK